MNEAEDKIITDLKILLGSDGWKQVKVILSNMAMSANEKLIKGYGENYISDNYYRAVIDVTRDLENYIQSEIDRYTKIIPKDSSELSE